MKTYSRTIILVLFFIIVQSQAVAGKLKIGESRLIETSGDPAIKSIRGSDIFVGISKVFPDEQSARNDAVLDARRQILQTLEVKITSERNIERLMIENQTGVLVNRDKIDVKTEAVAKGVISVQPEGFYIEKRQKQISKKEVAHEYKAWCMMRYSQAEHERIVTSIVSTMLDAVIPLINKAETAHSEGKIRDVLRIITQIKGLTTDIADYPAIPVELKTRINEVSDQVAELIGSIKLLVALYERIEGEKSYSPQFQPRLTKALVQQNLISIQSSLDWSNLDPDGLLMDVSVQKTLAEEMDADLLLVGIAEVLNINDSKADYGIYTARMRARLKLIDPITSTILWETTIPGDLVKAKTYFANNPEDAALGALSLAESRKNEDASDSFTVLSEDMVGVFK